MLWVSSPRTSPLVHLDPHVGFYVLILEQHDQNNFRLHTGQSCLHLEDRKSPSSHIQASNFIDVILQYILEESAEFLQLQQFFELISPQGMSQPTLHHIFHILVYLLDIIPQPPTQNYSLQHPNLTFCTRSQHVLSRFHSLLRAFPKLNNTRAAIIMSFLPRIFNHSLFLNP